MYSKLIKGLKQREESVTRVDLAKLFMSSSRKWSQIPTHLTQDIWWQERKLHLYSVHSPQCLCALWPLCPHLRHIICGQQPMNETVYPLCWAAAYRWNKPHADVCIFVSFGVDFFFSFILTEHRQFWTDLLSMVNTRLLLLYKSLSSSLDL